MAMTNNKTIMTIKTTRIITNSNTSSQSQTIPCKDQPQTPAVFYKIKMTLNEKKIRIIKMTSTNHKLTIVQRTLNITRTSNLLFLVRKTRMR